MGTNYYYHTNICGHCDRADVLHVGKQSMGWSFHFRAYRTYRSGDPAIESIAHWERTFKTVPGILKDENGKEISHPLEFLAGLPRPTPEQQAVEDSPDTRGGWPIDPEREWRDAEGFHFYDGEFS